jgi:cell division inhibitor SepF
MAGTMHKMAVYLGLVEDDPRYDDGYDSYEEYEDEYSEPGEPAEPEAERPAAPRSRSEFVMDPAPPAAPRASTHVAGHRRALP